MLGVSTKALMVIVSKRNTTSGNKSCDNEKIFGRNINDFSGDLHRP